MNSQDFDHQPAVVSYHPLCQCKLCGQRVWKQHSTPPTQRFNMGALPSGSQNSYPYSAVTVEWRNWTSSHNWQKLTMIPSLGNTFRESQLKHKG